MRLSALVSVTRGTWKEDKKEGRAYCGGKLKVGEEELRGQLKDHPTRGDLKVGVRFYELGLGAARVQAHIY